MQNSRRNGVWVLLGILILAGAGGLSWVRLRKTRARPEPTPSVAAHPAERTVADAGTTAAAPPVPVRPEHTAAGTPPGEKKETFPLWQLHTPPPGRELPLPAGARTLSMDLEGDGRRLALVTMDADGKSAVWLWDFTGPATALALPAEAAGATVREVLFSRFTRNVYLIIEQGSTWRIVASRIEGSQLGALRTVYSTSALLRNLRTASVLYDDQERLFFARAYAKDRFQILSVRAKGDAVYELTSPTAAATELTDAALRPPPPRDADVDSRPPKLPNVEAAVSALPLSIHAFEGTLQWQDERGVLHERRYNGNWDDSTAVKDVPAGTEAIDTANGFFRVRFLPGRKGVELVRMTNAKEGVIAADLMLVRSPLIAPTVRTLIGLVRSESAPQERVVTAPIDAKLAPARFLYSVGDDSYKRRNDNDMERSQTGLRDGRQRMFSDLAQRGMQLQATSDEQIYNTYERFEYGPCHDAVEVPLLASIDGYLEVLSAGFQAVFMTLEQNVSRPRLAKFLSRLQETARREKLARIMRIAEVSQLILKGDYHHPEAALVMAEKPAESKLHTVPEKSEIDFGDCHPRGPYAATPELQNYFRAFKYINLLRVTAAEQEKLVADGELREAWRSWVSTQKPFVSGSRQSLLFDAESKPPAHALAQCMPDSPPRLFPLSWGIDSEIWERVVMHQDLPESCGVAGRMLPSGLDLMSVLGSPEAQALQEREYAALPALRAAHKALQARLPRPLPTALLPEAWLSLIQLLGNDSYVPEGVTPTLWRRRMLQTALASWTNFRHTTVLVNEESGAECGGGDWEPFEQLSWEPLRGAVDPLPAQWRQLGKILELLSQHAKTALPELTTSELLHGCAVQAEQFGSMAERQIRGVPLTEAEYDLIQRYSGEIEHPYIQLKATVSRRKEGLEYGLAIPDPMTKIVDIAHSDREFLHMAVGAPIAATVLLGDRGLLVPARGAIYSYYEVSASERIDDDSWRSQLASEKPPAWAPELSLPSP